MGKIICGYSTSFSASLFVIKDYFVVIDYEFSLSVMVLLLDGYIPKPN